MTIVNRNNTIYKIVIKNLFAYNYIIFSAETDKEQLLLTSQSVGGTQPRQVSRQPGVNPAMQPADYSFCSDPEIFYDATVLIPAPPLTR